MKELLDTRKIISVSSGFMRRVCEFVIALFVCCQAQANYTGSGDASPIRTVDILSTNWIGDVRRTLPSLFPKTQITFQEATNLLCRESQHGNSVAQGLWGMVVLVQSKSPEEATNGLQLIRHSAENGYVQAMMNLGLLYQNGQYVQRDDREAFNWFSKAADRNCPEGLLNVGVCILHGLGTDRDPKKGADYYRRAAEMTNYVAMKSLGYLLMNGIGVEKDTEEAKRWFTRAANEGGNRRAMYNLGVLALAETNKMEEAYQWFKKSAELGDSLASWQLATFYYNGLGRILQPDTEAYRFWRFKAATSGSTVAQYMLGVAYRIGDGVPQDTESSLAWYRKAAAKNFPRALYDLAVHYSGDRTNRLSLLTAENYMLQAANAGHREAQLQCAFISFQGPTGPSDCDRGKQWLTKAAENGWGRAEFLLFRMFYNGAPPSPSCPSYPKDLPEAIKWIRRAATHGSLEAQDVLAVMLIQGKDVDKDVTEAEKLLRNAAEHGLASAQGDLGFAILNGDVKGDLIEAAMWCQVAIAHTKDANVLRPSKVNLSNVLKRLTSDQQLEAESRAKDFRAKLVTETDPMIKEEGLPSYQQEDGQL